MPPYYIAMLVPNADITLASSRIARAADNPATRHELPGLLADLTVAYQRLMAAACADPNIKRAVECGLRSTRELDHPEETTT